MAIYCPSCGRSIPNDSKVCAYCGKAIPSHGVITAPEPEKKKETNIALIIAIILVVLIVATIAIAATVYVYVSGLVPNEGFLSYEDATISITTHNDLIVVTLVKSGDNYNGGYTDYTIFVNGELVENLSEVVYWTVGEQINIGTDASGYIVNGNELDPGVYSVTVTFRGTLVYAGTVTIT